jgi:uncharacterized protein (TIGR03118 family)
MNSNLLKKIVAIVLTGLFLVSTGAIAANRYEQRNLVSDGAPADHMDKNLVNAWGIAFNPDGFVWVADNGTGVSTLYDGDGNPQTLVVKILGPGDSSSSPTGIVFNGSSDFKVPKDNPQGNPSRFIFATEQGTIAAWAPLPNAPPPTETITVVDNSNSVSPPIYKGLALAANGTGHFLYATDFHNSKIDVFDANFNPVTLSGKFDDPNIPAGFAPFGIQNINGDLYVTYAKQDEGKEDDVPGPGNGFVDVFDANGNFIRRFVSRGRLNAPWGVALAPAKFGKFSNRLLVGNFGNGRLNAYDLATGKFRGRLHGTDGHPLKIEGLWGIAFGNGLFKQPTDVLFFTSGPNEEQNGLYGRIAPAP